MMPYLLVFIGGGLGSILRYFISHITSPHNPSNFPTATFIANILSCFLLGILYNYLPKLSLADNAKLLLVTGFCGGFSTFSTLSMEVVNLLQKGSLILALVYIFSSLVLGILAVWLGILISIKF